ncbi:uncharacterized protein LOC119603112 [Lucilia sericata]|uniref:uncharacterized protein LOC119603112 n=1 Tax=Lucilia sericata TaxID=13632 RepID=UPI0018A834E1|nr:uncharacterized protein LOC119603112 [Lucilia sericata]
MKCAVKNCKSTNNSKACEISFFLFPTDASIQKQWVSFCDREKQINPKTSYVCMLHFKDEDVENRLQYEMGFAKRRLLKPGTVPSIKHDPFENKELGEEQLSIIEQQENKKIVALILQEYNCIKNIEQKENITDDVQNLGNFKTIIEDIGSENIQPYLCMEELKHLRTEV